MEQMRIIESDIPPGMTVPEYRRLIRPPMRHPGIRRLTSLGRNRRAG